MFPLEEMCILVVDLFGRSSKRCQRFSTAIGDGINDEQTLMASFDFFAKNLCCSVLYGLLRRLRTLRALESDTTLVARETAPDATMMSDTTLCVPISKRK